MQPESYEATKLGNRDIRAVQVFVNAGELVTVMLERTTSLLSRWQRLTVRYQISISCPDLTTMERRGSTMQGSRSIP